jgi:hypothetical protein
MMNALRQSIRKMMGRVGADSQSDHIRQIHNNMLWQERRIDRAYQQRTGHPIGDVLEKRTPPPQPHNRMSRVM